MGMMMNLAASRMRALPLAMLQGKLGALWNPEIDPGWRLNLLERTQEFSNAYWTKSAGATMTDGYATAPDGTMTACRWQSVSDGVVAAGFSRSVSGHQSVPLAGSIYVKYISGSPWVRFVISDGGSNQCRVWVNAQTGVKGTQNSNGTGTIIGADVQTVGSGWFRISAIGTQPGTAAVFTAACQVSDGSTVQTNGEFLIWGAQLERGTAATAYQKITDVSTEYIAAVGTPRLWQEGNGTVITPVTALEQSVGMIFDPSKGLAIGSERVANTTFDTADSWTLSNAAITISGGALRFTACPTTNTAACTTGTFPAAVVGSTYRLVVEISSITAGTVRVIHGGSVRDLTTAGTHTLYLMATGASGQTTLQAIGTTTAVIESVSCKAIAGVHLYAPQANRGVLSSRFNLLIYSEDFANSAWARTALSTVQAPDSNGLSKLVEDSTTSEHKVVQNVSLVSGTPYRLRMRAKAAERSTFSFYGSGGLSTGTAVSVDLAAGTVSGGTNATITAVGGGVYEVATDATSSFTGANALHIRIGTGSYAGNGSSGVLVGKADLRLLADTLLNIPAYQRVTTATDYDYQGFPCYIRFNGTSNWYTNPLVDLSGTAALTAFAGVTKLSDAGAGIVMETSANANTNNGSFYLAAPNGAATNCGFASRGTANFATTFNGIAAPANVRLIGIASISGDLVQLRVNGVNGTPVTNDQGTGNYANQVLNIGARAGTSLFFNGRMFYGGLLGENASPAFLENLDRWGKQRMRMAA